MGDKDLAIGEPIKVQTEFGPLLVRHLAKGRVEGVIVTGPRRFTNPVPIRIQSSCLFSESFRARGCDCAAQLHAALQIIVSEGGLLVYLYEEGRGAGLASKIAAIRLQQLSKAKGIDLDTASAFRELGLQADRRDHHVAAEAAKAMIGDADVEIITNNPKRIADLKNDGLHIVSRRPLVLRIDEMTSDYLEEKSRCLGHMIDG